MSLLKFFLNAWQQYRSAGLYALLLLLGGFGLHGCTGANQRLLQRAKLAPQTSSIRLTLTGSRARVEEHRRRPRRNSLEYAALNRYRAKALDHHQQPQSDETLEAPYRRHRVTLPGPMPLPSLRDRLSAWQTQSKACHQPRSLEK